MEIGQGKVFYKPEAGTYLATIIDLIEKPGVQTAYGLKNKVLVSWVISHMNGAPYLDPEGQPYTVAAYVTASMNEKSTQPLFRNLYKLVVGVLNGAQPPLIVSTEQLAQLLIGRSNVLMVTKEPNPTKAGDFYVNPVGVLPLPAGVQPPQAPTGFVRYKDKPKTQTGPQGQSVQTYAQRPAPTQNTVSFAPAPTAPPANEAF